MNTQLKATDRLEIIWDGSSATRKPTREIVWPRFYWLLIHGLTVNGATHVVRVRESKIVEHIVRDGVGDVASVNVECRKHDTDPDLED
jgi:hypothetical protein